MGFIIMKRPPFGRICLDFFSGNRKQFQLNDECPPLNISRNTCGIIWNFNPGGDFYHNPKTGHNTIPVYLLPGKRPRIFLVGRQAFPFEMAPV